MRALSLYMLCVALFTHLRYSFPRRSAAHFANVAQPSPFFSQERAPTSVAYAETQSMFLDSLVDDAAWLGRYARSREGTPMPWDLVEAGIRATHPTAVLSLRGMIAVCYFEKAMYEMSEEQLSAPGALERLAAEVETRIQGGPSPRPLLTVPHILSDESSCYCACPRDGHRIVASLR